MRRLSIAALSVVLLGVSVTADDPVLRGFTRESSVKQREWEAKFRAIPDPGRLREAMRHLSARPHHVGSPYGKAERRVDPGDRFASWGLGRADRDLRRCSFRRRRSGVLELVAPTRFVAKLEEPALAGDPTSGAASRAAPDLQLLLGRRRRHRAAGLRELRRARRLRGARAARHLGERRDRDRAVRRLLARHQAEGRRRARRGRLHHLLRSARRRLLRGRRVSRRARCAPATACSAAACSTCRSYPGDPLTPGVGATAGRAASRSQGRADAHEDPGAADLLRRRAAAARRARRPGGAGRLARRAADHVSRRPRPGEGPPQARVQLGPDAASTTWSRGSRGPSCPTSGSCAATTTTAG